MAVRRWMEAFAVMLLLVGLCGPASANSQATALAVGEKAPQFAGTDLAGNPVDLAAIVSRSKAVLVNFWGLRCGACLQEMPKLDTLHEKYGKSGLVVIGVNVDGINAGIIKAQLPRIQGKMPLYTVMPDEELKVADLYKLSAAPLSVVVDREGKIAYSHEGYNPGDEKELESRIEKLLAP